MNRSSVVLAGLFLLPCLAGTLGACDATATGTISVQVGPGQDGGNSTGPGTTTDGGSTGTPDADGGSDGSVDAAPPVVPPTSKITNPNPIISRGKKVASNGGAGAPFLVDGKYNDQQFWTVSNPSDAAPIWAAIDVGVGPTKLLLVWTASANGNYDTTADGGPGAYRIETSADSTDGNGGTWKLVAAVTDNKVRTRGHSFDFTGQRWVRFVLTAAAADAGGTVKIDEIDLHDGSKGLEDSWIFIGDSITALTFSRGELTTPSFATDISKAHPKFFPAMIGAGIGGTATDTGLAVLDEKLRVHPDFRYWAVCYGTNDSGLDDPSFVALYEKNMRAILTKIKAAGHIPIIPHIPYSTSGHTQIPKYNAVVDKLTVEFKLPQGPDLYGWFKAHPEQLADGVHPTTEGSVAIQKLWADDVAVLYP